MVAKKAAEFVAAETARAAMAADVMAAAGVAVEAAVDAAADLVAAALATVVVMVAAASVAAKAAVVDGAGPAGEARANQPMLAAVGTEEAHNGIAALSFARLFSLPMLVPAATPDSAVAIWATAAPMESAAPMVETAAPMEAVARWAEASAEAMGTAALAEEAVETAALAEEEVAMGDAEADSVERSMVVVLSSRIPMAMSRPLTPDRRCTS